VSGTESLTAEDVFIEGWEGSSSKEIRRGINMVLSCQSDLRQAMTVTQHPARKLNSEAVAAKIK
jgi:hypothetical protein